MKETLRNLPVLSGPFQTFDVNSVPSQPDLLFREWMTDAIEKGVLEPHAMTLSTVDRDGAPDARVLILKNVKENRWYFASSSESAKGTQLKEIPAAALTFYWPELGKQIRIRGKVSVAGKVECEEDFIQRRTMAKAIALIGKQSSVMKDLDVFGNQLEEMHGIVQKDPNVVYSNWALYFVEANEVEFWQGDMDRKHMRLRYKLGSDNWKHNLLYP